MRLFLPIVSSTLRQVPRWRITMEDGEKKVMTMKEFSDDGMAAVFAVGVGGPEEQEEPEEPEEPEPRRARLACVSRRAIASAPR